MKDKKILIASSIALLFILSIGLSYAWFSATVTQKDVKDQVVSTGTLELTYTDGVQIVMNDIRPGQTLTKKISVKNTGTLSAEYNLVWQELTNEILKDEMVMSATCERLNASGVKEGTCDGLDETPVSGNTVKKRISIEPSVTHTYTFTFTFKEIKGDQNYNQGKKFTGVLGVNEYKQASVNCSFDGTLTQGAEFTKGQYTYHYMQEYKETIIEMNSKQGNDNGVRFMMAASSYDWANISTEGWGMHINTSDTSSTLTETPCTSIGGKPVVSMSNLLAESDAESIDVTNFNTTNVTNMNNMFANFGGKIIGFENIDTSNVTNMSGMFKYSAETSISFNNINTSKVTDMSSMFRFSSLTSLDLSKFDTSNVTNMSSMFDSIDVDSLDLSNFNTSKVTDMSKMFFQSYVSTLNLSSFDTSNVSTMKEMFSVCRATELDLSSFVINDNTILTDMFNSASATKGYAKDSATVTKLNNSSNIPSALKFTVKSS